MAIFVLCGNKAFPHDLTSAMLAVGGHVGVSNQSRGGGTLFICKRILLSQEYCIPAGYVSENAL